MIGNVWWSLNQYVLGQVGIWLTPEWFSEWFLFINSITVFECSECQALFQSLGIWHWQKFLPLRSPYTAQEMQFWSVTYRFLFSRKDMNIWRNVLSLNTLDYQTLYLFLAQFSGSFSSVFWLLLLSPLSKSSHLYFLSH